MSIKREYGLILLAYLVLALILLGLMFLLTSDFRSFNVYLDTRTYLAVSFFFISPLVLLSIRRNGDNVESEMMFKDLVQLFIVRLITVYFTLWILDAFYYIRINLVLISAIVLMSVVYSSMDIILIHYWKNEYLDEVENVFHVVKVVAAYVAKIFLTYIMGFVVFGQLASYFLHF